MGQTLRVTDAEAGPASSRRVSDPAAAASPDVLAMPTPVDLATMAVGIVAVSTSGPLMAATAAPALAIAFWRNAMAASVLTPWTLLRHRGEVLALTPRTRRLAVLAGLFLAAHFATWVPSLTYTSVASATALVSTQPVWAALLARRAGARIARAAWVGIVVAVGGAVVLTGADISASGRALTGDLLAVAGGMFAAAYMVAGSAVRRHVSTATYTTVCYATAALLLLVTCAVAGSALSGYPSSAWARLVAVTAGAQFLGHSLFNRVLRTVSPTMVSLAILFEVPGAALVAAVWLHQTPPATALPGLLMLLAGVAVVVAARDRRTAPSVPVE
jgi:drug/metabolite transporter (DMT)-like permease